MSSIRLVPALAALAIGASTLAGAPDEVVIYAINHQGLFPTFGDTIIRFNASAPQKYETLGPTGLNNIGLGGLEFDEDGNLWAYASFNSFGGAVSGLYKIDLKTGAATAQGSPSSQNLSDLAWNPVNKQMYGVYSQGLSIGRLYTVNLQSGAVSLVGEFSGLDPQNNLVGLGISADGTFYVYDNMNNKFYVSDENLNLTLLYDSSVTQCEGCAAAVGSQGIGIDWSRSNLGYHGAAGQGVFPNYYGTLNTFMLDGSAYVWGPEFGPPLGTGPLYPPNVQAGDVAVVPATAAPCAAADLNCDGSINVNDLLMVINAWGACPAPPTACPADVDDDGMVNVNDLLQVITNWS